MTRLPCWDNVAYQPGGQPIPNRDHHLSQSPRRRIVRLQDRRTNEYYIFLVADLLPLITIQLSCQSLFILPCGGRQIPRSTKVLTSSISFREPLSSGKRKEAWTAPGYSIISASLPFFFKLSKYIRCQSCSGSSSPTATITGGNLSPRSSAANTGLAAGWSLLAPPGRKTLHIQSDVSIGTTDPRPKRSSESTLLSPPKKGWIATIPASCT